MKPMVPNTRIGGKAFTVSIPALTNALKATELVSAIVGMKNATEIVYNVNNGTNDTSNPAEKP